MFLPHIILASRSPQRLRLLESIVGPERVESFAPPSSEEQGFDGLTRWPDIRQRLLEIAGNKLRQIRQMREPRVGEIVLAADTTIVIASSPDGDALLPETDGLETLGQPDAGDWRPQVRRWFRDHYAGRTHWAATAVVAAWADGTIREAVATTAITMRPDVDTFLEAYLATGESLGKAGGYAIQGAGSLFVTRIEGSLSNVIGLPLEIITPWIVAST